MVCQTWWTSQDFVRQILKSRDLENEVLEICKIWSAKYLIFCPQNIENARKYWISRVAFNNSNNTCPGKSRQRLLRSLTLTTAKLWEGWLRTYENLNVNHYFTGTENLIMERLSGFGVLNFGFVYVVPRPFANTQKSPNCLTKSLMNGYTMNYFCIQKQLS